MREGGREERGGRGQAVMDATPAWPGALGLSKPGLGSPASVSSSVRQE